MRKRRVAILVMTVLAAAASIATDDTAPERWVIEERDFSDSGEISPGATAIFEVEISRAALPPELIADGSLVTEACGHANPRESVESDIEIASEGIVRASGRGTGEVGAPIEACFDPVGSVCAIDAACTFRVDVTVTPPAPAHMQLSLRVKQHETRDGPIAPSDAKIDVDFVGWR